MTADPDYLAFQEVFYDALAGVENTVADASPMDVLRRVTVAAFRNAPEVTSLLAPLNEVAAAGTLESAVAAARRRYALPEEFAEAIYFARCLGRDGEQTLRLLAGRTYLHQAHIPPGTHPELLTDRVSILQLANYERGWRDPARLEGSLNLIRIWRQEFSKIYEAAHSEHKTAVFAIDDQVEALRTAASALRRLNELRRLGPPLGLEALSQFPGLERLSPCYIHDSVLAASLTSSPVCPMCGFKLGDVAPAAEAKQVSTMIERGLSTQQARLSRRVIGRLLAHTAIEPQTKLQRFLDVVQASDLTGLAAVIDDEIVAFLDDLLADGSPGSGLLDRLANAFPTVSPANLETAVEEFRRLLTDETAHDGIVRLRSPADDRPERQNDGS